MKNKCNYYEVEYAKLPNPITGRLYSQRIEHCLSVKENDLCSCGGDKTKCSFPEVKQRGKFMTKREAIELENKCDELMSKHLQEDCIVSMALTGKLKIEFGSNYFTLDMDEKVASYIKYHGFYDMLEFYIESAIKCVDENKDVFRKLLWSYEHITELE